MKVLMYHSSVNSSGREMNERNGFAGRDGLGGDKVDIGDTNDQLFGRTTKHLAGQKVHSGFSKQLLVQFLAAGDPPPSQFLGERECQE